MPPLAHVRKWPRCAPRPLALLATLVTVAPLSAQGTPRPALDPWDPSPDRKERKALERLEDDRLDLDIVAEAPRTVDPCRRAAGPNLVNFIRRGSAPGEPTYMFGIDLCSRRPFVYEEPTRTGAIVGFEANPPEIHWAEDLSDDRNLRGDRFPVEGLVGVEMLFGTSTLDYGETANGSVDFAAAPSLGLRVDRFRVTYAHSVAPLERSWIAKFAVTPFRRGPPSAPAPVPEPLPGTGEARTTWFDAIDDPCNAPGVGIRGADHFRVGHLDGKQYPVSLQMVSYCTRPHRSYDVRTHTNQAWFSQFNNTFPKFASWNEVPRGGLLPSLTFSVGYGEIVNDVFNVDFPTDVIYVGLGVSFSDSRWRVDAGRLFSNDSLDLISAGVPVTVTTNGWTVQVQRVLNLELLK